MSDQKINLGGVNVAPQPGEDSFVPPHELVPLPSKGKIYPPEFPLAGQESIEIRAMTARDEDILTSPALLKSGKAIDTLLKSCVVNKFINPELMLTGDRNAILIAIRVTGYGPEYRIKVECPACGNSVEHEFNLAALPIKELSADPVNPGVNEFEVYLPVSKKRATVKLLNGADEKEISVILDKTKKANDRAGGVNPLVTTRLLFSVISIGNERDRNKLAPIIRNLPARDSRALRQFIDKIAPGVQMVQSFSCPSCEAESEVDVPMGPEFFWPSTGE